MLKLDVESIRNIPLMPHPALDPKEYPGIPGDQHYKLLAWFSTQWSGVELIDIGSHHGASAYALAHNSKNNVLSFDIVNSVKCSAPNIKWIQANLWDDPVRNIWKDRLLASPFIFLDVDPHNGTMEMDFYQWLVKNKYQGLLVCDDIWYFYMMRQLFWANVSTPKIDLTRVGHWSGTGVVNFASILESPFPPTDHWTLVTAYFNLTKEPDSSPEIKERDVSYYLKHAKDTMSVDQNLVVYCDKESRSQLELLRPTHLMSKTIFHEIEFSEFDIVQSCRSKIWENRKKHPYNFDPRNTASYYLLCMVRYVIMKQTMEENPFKSTHFAWINMCMERMGWKNLAALSEVFEISRSKFSTCWIDYQPKELVENFELYFQYGRCGMCSGFFTGELTYFQKFCDKILSVFHECLEQGYGHADEQLYSIVYFRHPELFDPYFGDYQEMITNYVEVRENLISPLSSIIFKSFHYKNFNVCQKACQALWNHRHKLIPDDLAHYLNFFIQSAIHNGDIVSAQKVLTQL